MRTGAHRANGGWASSWRFARALVAAAPCCCLAAASSGCMWIPGAVVAVVLLSDEDDEPVEPATVPPPAPAPIDLRGPFVALDVFPTAVAVGRFIGARGTAGGDPHPDVAVLSEDVSVVLVFAGDGTGRFIDRRHIPLSAGARQPKTLKTVPGDAADGLVVATSSTLEYLEADEGDGGMKLVQTIALAPERERRDLEIGDFDGDGLPDAAISSQDSKAISTFLGRAGSDGFRFEHAASFFADSPRAIAAANFDADAKGLTDLAALVVTGNVPRIELLGSAGDGATFVEVDELRVPDALTGSRAALDARGDARFEDDPYPDMLLARTGNAHKILVQRRPSPAPDPARPVLSLFSRGSGPFVHDPAGIAIVRLTRPEAPARELWDAVAGDRVRSALCFTYATGDGVEVEKEFRYPIPGIPEALAAGDLDLDGLDDVVAVSSAPDTLSVLLGRPPATDIMSHPLRHPSATAVGENRPLLERSDLVFGFRGAQRTRPFLAAKGESREVVVVLLEEATFPDAWASASRERFTVREEEDDIKQLVVADLDLVGGDELLVLTARGKALILRDPWAGLEEYLQELDRLPNFPPDLVGASLRCRCPAVGSLDEDPFADLVIPITVQERADAEADPTRDYVVVLRNPERWRSPPDATFYLVDNDPRSVAIANLDGDTYPDGSPVLDILAACEGPFEVDADGEDTGRRRLSVLRGDPSRAGRFLEREAFVVPAADFDFVATDNRPGEYAEKARVVLASTRYAVYILWNLSEPGRLELTECDPQKHVVVDGGKDFEQVVLEDVCGDAGLDLVAGDEDASAFVILENAHGFGTEGRNPFVVRSRIENVMSGQFFLRLFPASTGSLVTLGCPDSNGEIRIFGRSPGTEECGFDWLATIPVAEEDRRGTRHGLAVAPGPAGEWTVASVLEDGDDETGETAVEVLRIPAGAAPEDLVRLGELPWTTWIPAAGGDPDALAVGRFDGDDALSDLFVHDAASGDLLCFPGQEDPVEPFSRSTAFILGMPSRPPLVSWRTARFSNGPDSLVFAFPSEAYAFDPGGPGISWALCRDAIGLESTCAGAAPLRDLSCGSCARDAEGISDRFEAMIVETALEVVRPGIPAAVLATGVSGVLGCADLDGDGLDDVALVDSRSTSLKIFLQGPPGSFGPGQEFGYGAATAPVDVAFPDLNGDGRTDVSFAALDGTVYSYLGDGRFLADGLSKVSLTETFASPDIEALRAADLDGDGRDELLVSARIPGLIVLDE